jgi:hypothetical protein
VPSWRRGLGRSKRRRRASTKFALRAMQTVKRPHDAEFFGSFPDPKRRSNFSQGPTPLNAPSSYDFRVHDTTGRQVRVRAAPTACRPASPPALLAGNSLRSKATSFAVRPRCARRQHACRIRRSPRGPPPNCGRCECDSVDSTGALIPQAHTISTDSVIVTFLRR